MANYWRQPQVALELIKNFDRRFAEFDAYIFKDIELHWWPDYCPVIVFWHPVKSGRNRHWLPNKGVEIMQVLHNNKVQWSQNEKCNGLTTYHDVLQEAFFNICLLLSMSMSISVFNSTVERCFSIMNHYGLRISHETICDIIRVVRSLLTEESKFCFQNGVPHRLTTLQSDDFRSGLLTNYQHWWRQWKGNWFYFKRYCFVIIL